MRCDEWKECKLDDLLNFRRGHDLPKTNMIDGIYPVAASNGIIGYHNEYTAKKPNITIGRSGNVGIPYYYDENIWAHNTTLYIDDFKGNVEKYIYYLLCSLNLENFRSGSAVPTLNRNHIHPLTVFATFNIPEQNAIAAVLSALDDKIELNNRINKNLEAQAQAIFKSWFVDFEPFRDGEFVDSELGPIPKGWRIICLGSICDSVSVSIKKDKQKRIFLNTGDIENGRFLHCNYSEVCTMPGQAKKTIQYGDILYSEIRPINKHFAYVNFESQDYVVSTKLMVLRCSSNWRRRIYHYLTQESTINLLQQEAETRSGTFPQIRFENLKALKIICADEDTEKKFIDILECIYESIDKNNQQNQTLAALRDTLLPKLISGEIRVPLEV